MQPSIGCRAGATLGARLAICPSLACELGQVVQPVCLRNTGRIDHVTEIVFRIGQNERRMFGRVAGRNLGRHLRRYHLSFAARQSDKALIEVVQPCTQ